MKPERRRDLVKILREAPPSSQHDIVTRLRAAGHEVTQATVSRDLREVGAVKVRMGDGLVYRLPDELPRPRGGDLLGRTALHTLAEFAVDIQPAGSLVVVKTAPGHAQAVARGIDFAGLTGVIGTVAGDDTIFVATPSNDVAQRVSSDWLSGIGMDDASTPAVSP